MGLSRTEVKLIGHRKEWAEIFSRESKLIIKEVGIKSLKLYHCGSTAIPNIVAKPIIDIVGEISNLEELDGLKERLEMIGYEFKGEYGIKGRRYSVLYNSAKTIGYCHLHVFN